MIANNGLPIKVTATWTDNDYWNRKWEDSDEMECVNVAGWLVRINGKKYPRGHTDGDGTPDWTYRYTGVNNDKFGKRIAIQRALQEAGLRIVESQLASVGKQ
jgi:hypothetical protein